MSDWRASSVVYCLRCGEGPMVQARHGVTGRGPWHKARGLCTLCYRRVNLEGRLDELYPKLRPVGKPTDVRRLMFPVLDGAACAETDPELFFVKPTNGADARRLMGQVRSVCGYGMVNGADDRPRWTQLSDSPCPSAAACLRWALENREAGIWAGTTEEQRQQMKASA